MACALKVLGGGKEWVATTILGRVEVSTAAKVGLVLRICAEVPCPLAVVTYDVGGQVPYWCCLLRAGWLMLPLLVGQTVSSAVGLFSAAKVGLMLKICAEVPRPLAVVTYAVGCR